MSAVLQEIITLLTSGISQVATGIGTGLTNLVKAIFIETVTEGGTTTTKLTTFGGVVVIFAGISLAIGLCRWVTNFVTSLGSSN